MLPLAYFKRKPILTVLLQVFALFSACSLSFGAESIKELPGLVLDIHLGSDVFDHQYQAASVSPQDNALWVAVKFHKVGDEQPWRYSLWKLNQKGEKIHEIPMDNLQDRPLGISSLMTLTNGDFLFIADPLNAPSMIKMSQQGKILFATPVPKSGTKASISKIMQTNDNYFLLLGNTSGSALVIKVDGDGKIIWEKVFDKGNKETLVDGVPTPGGGAIVIGSSTIYQEQSISPSEIFILKVDKEGKLQVVRDFQGRFGPLSLGYPNCLLQTKDGRYVIVYDKENSLDRSIWIKAMDRTFHDVWETSFLQLKHDAGMFKIVHGLSGDFLVAGSKNFYLAVSALSPDGKTIWNYLADTITKRRMAIFDLISNNGKIFILYTVHSSNVQKQRNDKIGILSFLPNGLLK